MLLEGLRSSDLCIICWNSTLLFGLIDMVNMIKFFPIGYSTFDWIQFHILSKGNAIERIDHFSRVLAQNLNSTGR